jgi:hypothetical protein
LQPPLAHIDIQQAVQGVPVAVGLAFEVDLSLTRGFGTPHRRHPFCQPGGVSERRRLEDVNPAIHEVETGQVKARLVFDLQ